MSRKVDQRQLEFVFTTGEVVTLPTAIWGGSVWRNRVDIIAHRLAVEPSEQRKVDVWEGAQILLSRELREIGATEAEINVEMRKYREAVTVELCRCRAQSG